MRIWLEKGKQKELLKHEKVLKKLTWQEFAKDLGISFGKLNSWVYEENLIDEKIFNKLTLSQEYKKFIVQKLSESWGQVKGGKLSEGNLKKIRLPKKNKKLAEFWGIMLGDGNVQRTEGYKIGTYNIKITGHAILDKDYLSNFVKPLGEKLFGIRSRVYKAKSNQGFNVVFDGRRIVDFFEKEHFKAGDKIKNLVTIPEWIRNNPQFLAACLRGLYDTDGCFYKLTNQNSYQVGFTNYNPALLNDTRNSLLSLGIGVSKISRGRDITITKKSEIAKFYKLIGFHNSKHLNKIKMIFSPV